MVQSLENGLRYSIEFIKMFLVVIYVWKMRSKKTISIVFILSLVLVMLVSCFFDISDFSFIYGIISILVIFCFTSGKHRAGLVVLTYICISILDMIIVNLFMGMFKISFQKIQESFYIGIICNSISLFIIIVYILLFRKKNGQLKITRVLLPIYIIGGLSLSVFLTALQLVKSNERNLSYRNGIFMGLGMTVVFLMFVCILLEYTQRENERLKTENDINNKLLETQSKYYLMLLQKESETKAFRHDINEQFMCMRILYEKEQYKELGLYISEVQAAIVELSSKFNIGNDYVSAIVTDLSNQYNDVILKWLGKLPELRLPYMDICTLFYNLLKNAFEAADYTKEKWVKVVIKIQEFNLIINISNCYTKVIRDNKGEFQSTKQGEGHGYGIQNIKKCVEKNQGEYDIILGKDTFQTEIILPNAVKI